MYTYFFRTLIFSILYFLGCHIAGLALGCGDGVCDGVDDPAIPPNAPPVDIPPKPPAPPLCWANDENPDG